MNWLHAIDRIELAASSLRRSADRARTLHGLRIVLQMERQLDPRQTPSAQKADHVRPILDLEDGEAFFLRAARTTARA